ncbi:MAG: hypothetical protein KGJ87_08685 [Planctomycetota bacterium]|nr:hypothetical protein [Planctomycetota bacterium]MDE2217216.1 hypothetical protein [Planctomycetota bacterium]
MINGLWTVEFISTMNLFGNGVLVLFDNRILGGDAGYYYSGRYNISNDDISGEVKVTRYDEKSIAVFGDIPQFSLVFSGKLVDDYNFDAIAQFKGNPNLKIQLKCKKKEDI